MTQANWFKAQTEQDRSGDILLSFSNQWLNKTKDTEISIIFRRRVPRAFVPLKMFIYIGVPASLLVGFAEIILVADVDPVSALRLLKRVGLTQHDVEEYFSRREKIGAYHIGRIFRFDKSISLAELKEKAGFTPPQSFVCLSKRASDWLLAKPSKPSTLRNTLSAQINTTSSVG